jgi:drug/metabolite transporter (DMT)-like permease
MTPYLLLIGGIVPSALAQILLKQASHHPYKSPPYLAYVVLSVSCYVLAFVLYTIILKHFPISMASPVMTIGVMLIVFCFGWLIGEEIHLRRAFGFLLGLVSIYFIVAD